jgi:hypothetical protein
MKSNTLNHDDIRRTWAAMQKSAHDEPLSEKEWNALSWSRWLTATALNSHPVTAVGPPLRPNVLTIWRFTSRSEPRAEGHPSSIE